MRDELLNIRSNEPDEGITGTGRFRQSILFHPSISTKDSLVSNLPSLSPEYWVGGLARSRSSQNDHFFCFCKIVNVLSSQLMPNFDLFNSATLTRERSLGSTMNMNELSSWIMRRSLRQNLVTISKTSKIKWNPTKDSEWKNCSGKPKARDPLPAVAPPITTRRRQRRCWWPFS